MSLQASGLAAWEIREMKLVAASVFCRALADAIGVDVAVEHFCSTIHIVSYLPVTFHGIGRIQVTFRF